MGPMNGNTIPNATLALPSRLYDGGSRPRFSIFDDGSGSFEPLRLVPKAKTVVLGVVSTKGFASMVEGNLIAEADQWAKLKLVVDTARKVRR